MALYDKIGSGYDFTRRADPYIVDRLLKNMEPQSGGRFLDLACGTGNYTLAFKEAGLEICGMDISRHMLDEARLKNPAIDWVLGDAEALPFADRCFQGAFCVLAIHHFSHLQKAMNEAYRVINKRLAIFTATADQMAGYWLNEYFPETMQKSIEQMPSLETIEGVMAAAGFRELAFETYPVREDLQDWFLYSGKHRPAMYLEPAVRLGISSFSSLSDPGEVDRGCEKLAVDIQSGRIQQVIRSYENGIGDYLIVTGNV